jgi:hypothetical protein
VVKKQRLRSKKGGKEKRAILAKFRKNMPLALQKRRKCFFICVLNGKYRTTTVLFKEHFNRKGRKGQQLREITGERNRNNNSKQTSYHQDTKTPRHQERRGQKQRRRIPG